LISRFADGVEEKEEIEDFLLISVGACCRARGSVMRLGSKSRLAAVVIAFSRMKSSGSEAVQDQQTFTVRKLI